MLAAAAKRYAYAILCSLLSSSEYLDRSTDYLEIVSTFLQQMHFYLMKIQSSLLRGMITTKH